MTDAQARKASMKKFPKLDDARIVKIRLASLQILKRVAYRDGLVDGYKKAMEYSKSKTHSS